MHDTTIDHIALLDRYVAAWNEPDPRRRGDLVGGLYAGAGRVVTPSLDVRGREAILEHIGEVFAEFVGTSGRRFRRTASTANHRGLLLRWELAADREPAAASGLNSLLLGPDGRIEVDSQFSEPPPEVGS